MGVLDLYWIHLNIIKNQSITLIMKRIMTM